MILIDRQPIVFEDLAAKYPRGGIENQVLVVMNESRNNYNFSSVEQLDFELNMRKEIINAARALHDSRMDFAVFRDARCNKEYWQLTGNGGFTLKDGVAADVAITDIFENGRKYGTECATAMMIVYYKAVLAVMGADTFNGLFTEIYLMNWDIQDDRMMACGNMEKVPDFMPGDRRYFKNPQVNPKTPQWQGENTIDLGDGTYYGHGIGIRKPEVILDVLNQTRRRGATQEAYLMDLLGNPDYKLLFRLI